MFKTMWKMPAKLFRQAEPDDPDPDPDAAPLASGSLEEMIKAADELDDSEDLTIQCAGRDRPITWEEIKGLRQARNFPVSA